MYHAFGSTEVVPPEMAGHWPDEATYLSGLAASLYSLRDQTASFDEGGILNPPIMAQVTALQATVEGATGLTLSDIVGFGTSVAALANATDVATAVTAVSDLINVGVEAVSAAGQAVGAASSVMSVVPVIGTFIQVVLGAVINLAEAEARYKEYTKQCEIRLAKQMDDGCAQLVAKARPTATGSKGPLPADFFRPLAYKWKTGAGDPTRLPLTVASMYVALTAGENQGMWGQRGHQLTSGIDPAVKRKMWELIKGIMDAVEEPGIKAIPTTPGDGGRALYPILQDIVRNLWVAGVINKDILSGIESEILDGHSKYIECPDLASGDVAAGAMPAAYDSCRRRVNLVDPFEAGLEQYQALLFENFWDYKSKTWKITGTTKPGGVLVLRGPALSNLLQGSSDALAAASQGTMFQPVLGLSGWQKALVVLGAAGLGYAVFTAMRQWGPRS